MKSPNDHIISPYDTAPTECHCFTCDWEGYSDELEQDVDYYEGRYIAQPLCPNCNRGTIEYD